MTVLELTSDNRLPGSKIGVVLAQLKTEPGATIAEIVALTGWQPHTARAALSGLRKRSHTIVKDKRGDVTCYRIVGDA